MLAGQKSVNHPFKIGEVFPINFIIVPLPRPDTRMCIVRKTKVRVEGCGSSSEADVKNSLRWWMTSINPPTSGYTRYVDLVLEKNLRDNLLQRLSSRGNSLARRACQNSERAERILCFGLCNCILRTIPYLVYIDSSRKERFE